MKPRVFRKFASIALVAAMAISSVSPVYATDVEDQPEITVESEAETDNPAGETEESEPVESEEASESSEESDPEESYPYIILLPTNEDVSYAYEEDHLSAELSTDEYGILLYEEGEDVSLTVDAEEFYIVNAADNSMVIDGTTVEDGICNFAMPAADLAVVFSMDNGDAPESETPERETEVPESEESEAVVGDSNVESEEESNVETEEESEKESNIESEEESNVETEEESEQESNIESEEESNMESEGESEEESNVESEKTDTEEAVMTEEESEKESETASDIDIADVENADMVEDEPELIEDVFPENGSEVELDAQYVWMHDTRFDPESYVPEYNSDFVDVSYEKGSVDFSAEGTYPVIYEATLKSDNDRAWDLILPFVVVSEKEMATVYSDSYDDLMFTEQDESYTGIVPEEIGDTVDGGTFHVYAGEDFDLWSLNLGYDLTKYNVGVSDDGGFDPDKAGSYEVAYEVNSYLNPEFQWTVMVKVVVGEPEAEEGAMTVHIKSGVLQASVILADGAEEKVSYGSDLVVEQAIKQIIVTSPMGNEIDPVVEVQKNGEADDNAIIYADLKDNIYTVDMDENLVIGDDAYTVIIDYPDYDPTEGGIRKSTGGLERDEEALALQDAEDSGAAIRTFAASRASSTIASKSFSNVGTCTALSGPVYNYNPPGTAYNEAQITLSTSFKKALQNFCEANDVKINKTLPASKWLACASGHGAAGWFNTSYCSRTTATARLIDSDGDGIANRISVTITAYGPDVDYQSMSGTFNLSTSDATGTLRIRKFTQSADFINEFPTVNINTNFGIYDNKACTSADLVQTVKVRADKGDDRVGVNVDLEPGTYYLKEIARCPGHIPNNTVYGPYKITAGNQVNTENIYNIPFYYTGLLLKKVDNNNKPLAGAIYKMTGTFQGETYTWFFKTDSNGQISYDAAHYVSSFNGQRSDALIKYNSTTYAVPIGSATFQEVQAPSGYVLDSSTFNINFYCKKDSSGNFIYEDNIQISVPTRQNKRQTGTIEIQKYMDSNKTNKNTISSAYTYAGAVYGVYKNSVSDSNLVDKITTNAAGYGKSKALDQGVQYYVKEISAPTCGAYDIDPTTYPVKLNSSTPVKISSYDAPKKGSMSLDKSLEGISEEDYQKAVEEGKLEDIRFSLVHENADNLRGEGRKQIATDKYGHAEIDGLVYGKWTMTETKAPDGYKLMDPVKFEVKPGSGANVELDIPNEPFQNFVQILKKDADTGNTITMDDAPFKIVNEFGSDVEVTINDSKTVEFKTTEGKILFTEPLSGGRYTLVEVEAPEGYLLADPVEFFVGEDGTIDSPLTVSMVDAPMMKKIKVTKVDKDTEEPIGKDFTFDIIVAEDILDGSSAVRTMDGVELVAGAVVDTITTGEDSTATSKDLYLGKYYVQETGVSDAGYAINPEKYPVELADDGTEDQLMEIGVTVPNEPTTVEIYKVDSLEGKALEGITFRVKEKDAEDADDQLYVTDKDGKITITHLVKDTTYTVQEVKTFPGYNLETEVVEFTVDENGLINGERVHEITFTNVPNEVHFSKQDVTNGEELPGATLTLTDAEGNVVDEWVSTEEAHVIYRLPAGKYTLTEKIAPEKYELASAIQFEIKDSKVVQTVIMKDAPYRQVEISKKDITNSEELPGATLEIYDSNNELIDQWVSEEEPHMIDLPSGKYMLVETKPADGYVTADSIEFEIMKRGEMGDVEIQKVEMFDDVTKVEISKKDISNEEELPGAELEIRDEDGNTVEKWTSTDEPHYIEKLPIGKYTLIETTAPEGYDISEAVEFEVGDTCEIQHVVMYDSPTPAPQGGVDTPQTGDGLDAEVAVGIAALVVILAAAGIYVFRKGKKKSGSPKDTFKENE